MDIGSKLDLSIHEISELLNHHMQTNFNQFINGFRIDKAKSILLDSPDMTVLDIGFDVGFNSKSSFNSIFKKTTGLTPSQFRKQKQQ